MYSYHTLIKKLACLTIAALCLVSCSRYLDVKPEDRFLDEQVFSSRQSAQNALNGIYLNMAKSGMYGASMTSTTVDVLAQYYNHPVTTRYYSLSTYNYSAGNAQGHIEAIWRPSYTAILNINLFIQGLAGAPNLFSAEENNLLLGEAYGLRAFIGLDLLRLFGPVYAIDSTALAVPYPTDPNVRVNTILQANVAMDSIMHDLQRAAELLQQDPIRTVGVQPPGEQDGDNFFKLRNRRMNYYAVQAIAARALLYRGNKNAALDRANAVIAEAGKWFPWSLPALSGSGQANPDRIFSSELLMGLPNFDLYTVQNDNFNATLLRNLLTPLPVRLEGIYEGLNNDYRYRSSWVIDPSSNLNQRTFFKYADIEDKSLPYRNLQPLIRLSELYYIVAECTPDEIVAEEHLNTVLFNRGLPDITIANNRMDLIAKEYAKEFWGEGQLFYYYKRTNAPSIINGNTGVGTVAMTPEKYRVPLPLSETEYR